MPCLTTTGWTPRSTAPRRRAWRAADIAVVANPHPGRLAGCTNLKLIQSLWAGVDRLLVDATLPADVPIARMVDPAMNRAMAETACWAVLSLHRRAFDYATQQREARWHPLPQRRADEIAVLVLGLGEMGRTAARQLAALGYAVAGWSARPQVVDGVASSAGWAALPAALASADIVVNLLPLTDGTRGLFDRARLAQMRRGASLVNLARGGHVVETDLLAALDFRAMAGARHPRTSSRPSRCRHACLLVPSARHGLAARGRPDGPAHGRGGRRGERRGRAARGRAGTSGGSGARLWAVAAATWRKRAVPPPGNIFWITTSSAIFLSASMNLPMLPRRACRDRDAALPSTNTPELAFWCVYVARCSASSREVGGRHLAFGDRGVLQPTRARRCSPCWASVPGR